MHGHRMIALAALVSVGCASDLEDSLPPPCAAPGAWRARFVSYGDAPWDRFTFDMEEGRCSLSPPEDGASHLLTDEDGEAVEVEADAAGLWSSPAGLDPGRYIFSMVQRVDLSGQPGVGIPVVAASAPFDVQPWGREEDFDPGALVGRAWTLDPSELSSQWAIDELLLSLFPDVELLLVVDAVEDGAAKARLLSAPLQEATGALGDACLLAELDASVSGTGELSFQTDALVVNEEPPVQVRELSLRAGWNAAGDEAAGVEAAFGLSFDQLALVELDDGLDDGEEYCTLWEWGGHPCDACPDGSEHCVDMVFHGGRMHEVQLGIPGDPPRCAAAGREEEAR